MFVKTIKCALGGESKNMFIKQTLRHKIAQNILKRRRKSFLREHMVEVKLLSQYLFLLSFVFHI